MNTSPAILFGKTPADAFGGATAKAVYMAFAHHASEKNGFTCWPSIQTVSNIVGRSIATIYRAIEELKKRGWISRDERFSRGMHTTSLTRLCIVKIKAAIAALKPRKPTVSGSLIVENKLSHYDRQKVKQKYKNTFSLPRKDKSLKIKRELDRINKITAADWE